MRGTAAHVGQSAAMEEGIAADFDNTVKCPHTGACSWFWLPLEIEGVLLDVAHHPGIGVSKNPATRFNGIRSLAARTLFDYANQRSRAPHLVVRAHNHTFRDSGDDYATRAITLPAWTLPTEYIYRIDPSAVADVGAVLVQVSAGYYEVEVKRFYPARQQVYSIGAIT